MERSNLWRKYLQQISLIVGVIDRYSAAGLMVKDTNWVQYITVRQDVYPTVALVFRPRAL